MLLLLILFSRCLNFVVRKCLEIAASLLFFLIAYFFNLYSYYPDHIFEHIKHTKLYLFLSALVQLFQIYQSRIFIYHIICHYICLFISNYLTYLITIKVCIMVTKKSLYTLTIPSAQKTKILPFCLIVIDPFYYLSKAYLSF